MSDANASLSSTTLNVSCHKRRTNVHTYTGRPTSFHQTVTQWTYRPTQHHHLHRQPQRGASWRLSAIVFITPSPGLSHELSAAGNPTLMPTKAAYTTYTPDERH